MKAGATEARPRLGPDVLFLVVGPLVLWTPLTRFLRDKSYPLFSPEVGVLFVGVGLLGLVVGLLMAYGGTRLRLLTAASLMTLYVDIQFLWLTRYFYLLLAMSGICLICWGLRTHLGRILLAIFSVLWLSSLMTPPKSFWKIEDNATDSGYDKTLPPLVHIILDEHIGIEGIPKAVDPHGHVARWLRKRYIDQGFTVFSRAYSRYTSTGFSLSALFNFANTDSPQQFVTKGTDTIYRLTKNALFERLKARGYKIHVLESSHLAFSPLTSKQLVEKRYVYDYASLQPIYQSSLSFLEKTVSSDL